MGFKSYILVAFGVLLTTAPAQAFEFTPAAPIDQGAAGGIVLPPAPNDPANLTDDEKSQETVIPGLGSIGLIPKLDFGLELLYSGDDAPIPDAPDDGIAVIGALKHSF